MTTKKTETTTEKKTAEEKTTASKQTTPKKTTSTTAKKPATKKTTTSTRKTAAQKRAEEEKRIQEEAEKLAEKILKEKMAEFEKEQEKKLLEETQKKVAELEKKLEEQVTKKQEDTNKLSDSDLVNVRSLVPGLLVYRSREGFRTTWEEFGDIQEMTIRDLRELRGYKKSFLEQGLIFIESEEAIKTLQLEQLYKNMKKFTNLEAILELSPEDLASTIKEMPEGMKESLSQLALKKYRSKELYDIRVIRTIKKYIGLDLELVV